MGDMLRLRAREGVAAGGVLRREHWVAAGGQPSVGCRGCHGRKGRVATTARH